MDYEQLRHHVGHKLELQDVTDWSSNLETSIELRCMEKECEGCEPLLDMDNPEVKRCKKCDRYARDIVKVCQCGQKF